MMTKMDVSVAKKVKKKKARYADFDSRLRRHHLERMLAMKEASVETHSIHMELMDALNQINIYSADIAKKLLKSGLLAGGEDVDNNMDSDKVASEPESKQ